MANLEKNLLALEARLQSGAWRNGGYTEIEGERTQTPTGFRSAFPDRVVHHALCAVVAPLFERGFIPDSYAK